MLMITHHALFWAHSVHFLMYSSHLLSEIVRHI